MFTEGYSFPHPVLGIEDDIQGDFTATLKAKRKSSTEKIILENIRFDVTNDYIGQLISTGQASFILKVYCSSSFKTWTFPFSESSIEIDEHDLINKVEVTAYLIASVDIEDYQDKSFHPNFDGLAFHVGQNEIIGVSGRVTLPIPKKFEKQGLGNIFKFHGNEDPNDPISFSFDHDKIHIYYPLTAEQEHLPNLVFKASPWIGYNLFIIPALADAFRYIREGSDFEDYEWCRVILELLPLEEQSNDDFVNAQVLLGGTLPVLRAFGEIKGKFDQ